MPSADPDESELSETTRRAVLAAAAGTLGTSVTGVESAHPGKDENSEDHGETDGEDDVIDTEIAGYHSLGGVDDESFGGHVGEPYYGLDGTGPPRGAWPGIRRLLLLPGADAYTAG